MNMNILLLKWEIYITKIFVEHKKIEQKLYGTDFESSAMHVVK